MSAYKIYIIVDIIAAATTIPYGSIHFLGYCATPMISKLIDIQYPNIISNLSRRRRFIVIERDVVRSIDRRCTGNGKHGLFNPAGIDSVRSTENVNAIPVVRSIPRDRAALHNKHIGICALGSIDCQTSAVNSAVVCDARRAAERCGQSRQISGCPHANRTAVAAAVRCFVDIGDIVGKISARNVHGRVLRHIDAAAIRRVVAADRAARHGEFRSVVKQHCTPESARAVVGDASAAHFNCRADAPDNSTAVRSLLGRMSRRTVIEGNLAAAHYDRSAVRCNPCTVS